MIDIVLQPFDKDDYHRLISWVDTKRLLFQFAGDQLFTFPLSEVQLASYISDSNSVIFKIVDNTNNKVLGHAEVFSVGANEVRICRILIGEEQYRGKGIGAKVVGLLVDFVRRNMRVDRITLNVYDWNITAISCYKKCGFSIAEGISSFTTFEQEVWKSIRMTYTLN